MDIEFVDDADASRFELRAGDEVVGFIDDRSAMTTSRMVYTEVGSAHSGHGYAAVLARGALVYDALLARAARRAVVPLRGVVHREVPQVR